MMKNHPHPGELLREDVLIPLGIEVTEAAQRLGVSWATLSIFWRMPRDNCSEREAKSGEQGP